MTRNLYFFCLSALLGCGEKAVLEKYNNGQTKTECQIVNSKKEGICHEYHSNGKLKIESNWKGGLQHGRLKSYYLNGKLEEDSFFSNGKLHGLAKIYYDNGRLQSLTWFRDGFKIGVQKIYYPTGKVAGVYEWIYAELSDNKLHNFVNTKKEYDERGRLTAQLHYAEIKALKDTVSFGTYYTVQIRLMHPMYNKMKVFIGDFNSEYSLSGLQSMDTLYGKYFEATYKKMTTKPGRNTIRGILRDYMEEVNNKGGINTDFTDYYFEKVYYVVQ